MKTPGCFQLATLVLTLSLSALAGSGCRPATGPNDPVQLIWDEDATGGFQKIQDLEEAKGIRVFWWNIGSGDFSHGVIDSNLVDLVGSRAKPDVLALGEYKVGALAPETVDFLEREYPYHTFAGYNRGANAVGDTVYSVFPFTANEPENLEWSPLYGTADEQRAYVKKWEAKIPAAHDWFVRPYIRLRATMAGRSFNVVVTHLLEPWEALRHQVSRLELWKDMIFGRDMPIYYQAQRLKALMHRDFGEDLGREPLLLIGDCNIPKSMTGLTPEVYDELQMDLGEVFTGEPTTFPSYSAPERQHFPFNWVGFQIDHAFTNIKADRTGAAVLPLKGSDHYPIYTVVRPL